MNILKNEKVQKSLKSLALVLGGLVLYAIGDYLQIVNVNDPYVAIVLAGLGSWLINNGKLIINQHAPWKKE